MGCGSIVCRSVACGSMACRYIDYRYMVYGSRVTFNKNPVGVLLGNRVVV